MKGNVSFFFKDLLLAVIISFLPRSLDRTMCLFFMFLFCVIVVVTSVCPFLRLHFHRILRIRVRRIPGAGGHYVKGVSSSWTASIFGKTQTERHVTPRSKCRVVVLYFVYTIARGTRFWLLPLRRSPDVHIPELPICCAVSIPVWQWLIATASKRIKRFGPTTAERGSCVELFVVPRRTVRKFLWKGFTPSLRVVRDQMLLDRPLK